MSHAAGPDGAPSKEPPLRRGVVAVIVRDARLLVIRRAQGIAAPGAICFPGGGVEAGESEPDALVRELVEELGVVVRPRRLLWKSVTDWRVQLAWWLAEAPDEALFVPNAAEVAEVQLRTVDELLVTDDLLSSNRAFLTLVSSGVIRLDV